MISTLDELVEHRNRFADSIPTLRDDLRIESPGCSDKEIAGVKERFPELPSTYIDVARRIRLKGATIGFFDLWPGVPASTDLAEALSYANNVDTNPLWDNYEHYGAREIGSWEQDPFAVVCIERVCRVHQVLMFDINDPSQDPEILTEDFEALLLAAGNLDSIRDRDKDCQDPLPGLEEFMDCLGRLAIPQTEATIGTWRMIAESTLL